MRITAATHCSQKRISTTGYDAEFGEVLSMVLDFTVVDLCIKLNRSQLLPFFTIHDSSSKKYAFKNFIFA